MPQYNKRTSYLIYFAAICCCALGGAFVKYSPFGACGTAVWRLAMAVVLMLPFVWKQLRRTERGVAFRLFLGGLLFGANLLLWNLSLLHTTQANASLLANLHVFFTVPLCWLLYQERPGKTFYLGLTVSLAGLLLLVFGKADPTRGAFIGDLEAVICTALYAGYMLSVYASRKRAPVGAALFYIALGGLVLLLPVLLFTEGFALPRGWAQIWPLLGVCLVGHFGGVGLVTYSLYRISAGTASTLSLAQPAVGALLGLALFGERLSWMELLGVLIVSVGVYWAQKEATSPPTNSPEQEKAAAPAKSV